MADEPSVKSTGAASDCARGRGQRAIICGLSSARGQALNGRKCMILGFNESRQRYVCKLDGHNEPEPLLLDETKLEILDAFNAVCPRLFTMRDSKQRMSCIPEAGIPRVLIVRLSDAYGGRYILQDDKHEGKPVWKGEYWARYINFHPLGYWLLGTFGPTPDPKARPMQLRHNDPSHFSNAKLLKGGFAESDSDWVHGFDFVHVASPTPLISFPGRDGRNGGPRME